MLVHKQHFRILIIFFLGLSILLPINVFAQEKQLPLMIAYANADSADEYSSYSSSTSYKKSSVNGFKLYIPYLVIGQFEIKVNYTDSINENYITTSYKVNEKLSISTIQYPIILISSESAAIKPFFIWNPQYVYDIKAERNYNNKTEKIDASNNAGIFDMFLSGFDFGFLFSDSIAAFVSFQIANIVLPDIENDESTRNFSIVSTGVGILF